MRVCTIFAMNSLHLPKKTKKKKKIQLLMYHHCAVFHTASVLFAVLPFNVQLFNLHSMKTMPPINTLQYHNQKLVSMVLFVCVPHLSCLIQETVSKHDHNLADQKSHKSHILLYARTPHKHPKPMTAGL